MSSPEKSFSDEDKLTVEELLSTVLQRKSKLSGKIKFNMRKVNQEEKEKPTPLNKHASSVTKSNHLQSLHSNPSHRNISASLFTDRVLPRRFLHNEPSHNVQPTPPSDFKMSRSVSTPEMNVKFRTEALSNSKSSVPRKIHFPSLLSSNRKPDDFAGSCQKKFTRQYNHTTEHYDPIPLESDEMNRSSSLSNLFKSCNHTNVLNKNNFYNKPKLFNPKSMSEHSKLTTEVSHSKLTTEQNHSKLTTGQNYKNSCSKISSVGGNVNGIQPSVNRDLPLPKFELSSNLPVRHAAASFKTPTSKAVAAMQPPQPSASPSLNFGNSDIIIVNNCQFLKLSKLGKGGSSVVYEALDLRTRQRRAIKIVTLDEEDEATRCSYRNEIKILQRLQYSPRIIKLHDFEESASQLHIVMEPGEIDLSRILNDVRQKNTSISAFSVQHYWQEMLLSVAVIHREGIIHSDLKPANFLLVNGKLKLIDFGIASSVQQDMTSVLKDSQSGTYNYMSPESLNDIYTGPIVNGKVEDKPTIKLSVKSDVWSLGCILYNLVYGKTPFQHLVKPLQKLAAISNAKTTISFPPVTNEHLLDVMQKCLRFNPYNRPSIKELLCHPYLEGGLMPHTLKELNK